MRLPERTARRRAVAAGLVVLALAAGVSAIRLTHGSAVPRDPGRATREPSPEALAAARRLRSLQRAEAGIAWRRSRAVGRPTGGRLIHGVQLPAQGVHFVTFDPVRKRVPNRGWRRYGTDRLVRTVLAVAAAHAAAHPGAPRMVVGDLSRPGGGEFGPRFGGGGHASHRNGLDVDVYYPRRDRREWSPASLPDVDRALTQDLVTRFVRAGAQYVFVAAGSGLHGPDTVVQPWRNHDDHMHVRLRAAG